MTKAERQSLFIEKIGNEAVQAAQRANRKNGIPNVCYKNGTLYFQLPNGDVTTKNPFDKLISRR